MGAHKCNWRVRFRDLESFNKALLAKNLWRIVTNPISLAAIVLREKYCKNGNFIEAKAKDTNHC